MKYHYFGSVFADNVIFHHHVLCVAVLSLFVNHKSLFLNRFHEEMFYSWR
jgi:hypothetical protein